MKELHADLPSLLQTLQDLKNNEARLNNCMSDLTNRNEELRLKLVQKDKTISSMSEENKGLLVLMEGIRKEK
jgi:chromosome segregation ATPase